MFRLLIVLVTTLVGTVPCKAFKPEDAAVKAMVDRGLKYLENPGQGKNVISGVPGTEEGTEVLVGYAAHKAGRDESYKLVHEGIQTALKLVKKDWTKNNTHLVYDLTVSCLLLADVDKEEYKAELTRIVDLLVRAQKREGGFGYPTDGYNDISQVQYALLALWTADRAGIDVPPSTIEKAINWIIRTQPASGGFVYRPRDPMAPQLQISPVHSIQTHPLTLAGMGTLLIAGDYFQFYVGTGDSAEAEGLPAALRRAREVSARRKTSVKPEQIERSIRASLSWIERTPYKRDKETWHYYMMYAAERYYSFAELAAGNQEAEPEWYNRGVSEMQAAQRPNGAWGDGPDIDRSNPVVATALGVLFLVRSTKKAIGVLNEGMAAGGFGLPKDTKNAKADGSQITGDPVATSLNDMLSMLEEEDNADLDPRAIPPALSLSKDPKERAEQISRLERLARGQVNSSWLGRRVAVRTLASAGDIHVVPTLIFALSDPDKPVKRMARDGLRLISRRFEGFGLPDDPTPEEVVTAQRKWKQWYLDLNPTYIFVD